MINNEPFIVASRGRNPENPSDRTTGSPTEQRLEPNSQGLCNTLTTVLKDNYVVEPRSMLIVGDNNLEISEFPSIIQKCGDRGSNNYSKSNISYTIPANAMSDRGQLLCDTKLRIRKLTPKECWRLMGFTDDDFSKAEGVNSNTQLYKQAGNSIVVPVLEGILGNLHSYSYL